MASNSQNPGENDTFNQIPLQDLSRSDINVPADGHSRGRANSVGGGVFSRRSLMGIGSRKQYQSVAEESPVDLGNANNRDPFQSPEDEENDLGALAQAMSFGITFDAPRLSLSDPSARHDFDGASDLDNVPLDNYNSHEPDNYAPQADDEDDTARLTDPRFLQPISGALAEGRPRSDTGGYSMHSGDGSRLGDDLPHVEDGLGRRRGSSARSRSLSPSASGGALQRASSMVKSMSQRVVNLSNEPEVVQQSIEREESHKNSRLEGPPVLPAMTDFAHDTTPGLPPRENRASGTMWKYRNNPFRGRSLGFLGPNNPFRLWLCDILVHSYMEPFILVIIVVQTILLIVESSRSVFNRPLAVHWGSTPLDYVFFAIFIIYTLEIGAKILVSGFIFNPREYSTLNRNLGIRQAIAEKGKNLITPHRQTTKKKVSFLQPDPQASILRTFTGMNALETETYDDPLQKRRTRLAHRAFLRHSFNRLDFVAIISYWVSFVLSLQGLEATHQLYIFRMMSCLRILRLLSLTNGTSVILRSLKRAAPLLVHVAFLIGFFWLLFAIVGIQSFKSSLRRTCVWVDPEGISNFTSNDPYGTIQFCGGYINSTTGENMPWLDSSGTVPASSTAKGYMCPIGSLCVEGSNPYNGTLSFDNIFQSLEAVFVIMSSNTFTDLLYYTTDSDYLASALFFAFGIVILSLWLVNLLVAVITHSFQVIREESKRSAFAIQKIDNVEDDDTMTRKVSTLKRFYDKTEYFWVLIIAYDLIIQALRSSTMGEERARFISNTELVVTLIFLLEIAVRFASDWRVFHRRRRNWFDLLLVVVTCVIQIPPIKNSGRAYTVLTLFQIFRVYRIVLAIPVTRKLINVVFRNTVGLLNLIFFLFLMTFLVSIFATQLFRSQIPSEDPSGNSISMTFADIYISFLGMYQILSSENWTTILYNVTAYTTNFNTAWISASFIILWFIVANFIILNMFIAVIQESFDVSEDEKRLQQVRAFLEQKHVGQATQGNLALSKILRLGRDSDRYKDPLDHGPAALEMLLKDAVVREFLDEEEEKLEGESETRRRETALPDSVAAETTNPGFISQALAKANALIMGREPNPFYSKLKFSRAYEELDPRTMAREVVSAAEARKRAQREYLIKHPKYNKSLYIFVPHHPIRKLCQRIVGPGRGNQRVEGVDPYKPVWYTFSAFIYAAIVAMVLLACITTPLYQRQYFSSDRNWFVYTDLGFAVVFTIEATIKVIADGFFWTPNAYFRSSWGFIDGVVLLTLWVNVGSTLYKDYSISRPIGAFKALRALRLLNVSDSAKDTFHSVIILGGMNVIAAAAVSLSFLIPFAIYALNLFNGQLLTCNDGNFSGNLTYCVNEYASSPYNWDVMGPRTVTNTYYDFDNFGDSLFILFQIVSQEGWIDVQERVMSIVGPGLQPQDNVAPANGFFFVVFNLLGAVFVLTLFVSVFMRNYTEQTGVAFLTAEQRSWLELRKLLRQISPSKRSLHEKSAQWQQWCYRIAVKKHGRWAHFVTFLLCIHLILLVLEFYPEPEMWELARSILFFIFMFVYVANVVIRFVGLGWHRFSRSSWDLYSLLVVPGAWVTTVLHIAYSTQVVLELNKLFLVAIALLLIPRNNQLDQLFKTAAASLPVIGNLLATCSNFLENDCGSAGWSRTLFIAWNIISMYIFVSLFVSLIFESFSYVYQRSSGLYAVSREEIRRFKQAWSTFDPDGTGFISKEQFPRLLGELSGIFTMRIYDGEFTVGAILDQCRTNARDSMVSFHSLNMHSTESLNPMMQPRGEDIVDEVNLKELNRILNRIPINTIRERRQRLNIFYEEVLVSADPDRGISFHQCLMILAHYNIISDSKSLRLEEFLRRRARLQRVEEAVRRNTVMGFFDTLYWSRRFRQAIDRKKNARMTTVPQFTVPEIYVDDPVDDSQEHEEPAPGTMTPQTQPDLEGAFAPMLSPSSTLHRRAESSPTAHRHDLPRLDTTMIGRSSGASTPTEWASISPSRTPRHMYGDRASFELGERRDSASGADHSQENSTMSVQDVMNSLDNSVWGESIRRSFTQRRSGERRSGERSNRSTQSTEPGSP
ncbi:hypothetical protein N7490_010320 [Penicillium lividum]|nr:hypothetical protein N7490_010320 [Penicillium lividum]